MNRHLFVLRIYVEVTASSLENAEKLGFRIVKKDLHDGLLDKYLANRIRQGKYSRKSQADISDYHIEIETER